VPDRDTVTRHDETWKLDTSQGETYKCQDRAKTMSPDSLETRHVSFDSITAKWLVKYRGVGL